MIESFKNLVSIFGSNDAALGYVLDGRRAFVEPGIYDVFSSHVGTGSILFGHDAEFRKVIATAGTDGQMFHLTACSLSGFKLGHYNPTSLATTFVPLIEVRDTGSLVDIHVYNGRQGAINCVGCNSVHIEGGFYELTRGHAIIFDDTHYSIVLNTEVRSNLDFGVRLVNTATFNEMRGMKSIGNGLELIGITSGCLYNRVIDNDARNSWDNGISISGDYTVVRGNICRENRYDGIGVFGSYNVVYGNIAINNGWAAAGAYGGISVREDTGAGNYNSVMGNIAQGGNDHGFIVKSETIGNVLRGNLDNGSIGGLLIEDPSRLGEENGTSV